MISNLITMIGSIVYLTLTCYFHFKIPPLVNLFWASWLLGYWFAQLFSGFKSLKQKWKNRQNPILILEKEFIKVLSKTGNKNQEEAFELLSPQTQTLLLFNSELMKEFNNLHICLDSNHLILYHVNEDGDYFPKGLWKNLTCLNKSANENEEN